MAVDLGRIGQKNIFWLQIAVHYTLAVNVMECAYYLTDDDSSVKFTDWPDRAVPKYEGPQIAARGQLGEGIPMYSSASIPGSWV